MKVGGRTLGIGIIALTLIVLFLSYQYTQRLEQQRSDAVAMLMTLPAQANCKYDDTTCPQAEEVTMPSTAVIGMILIAILLAIYLIRSDTTQQQILLELEQKRKQLSRDERYELITSILTKEEQKIIRAVKEQPGISQATLRLRTDLSKAKLSILLKELENRALIVKTEDGKTNIVHLKREL